MKTFAIVTFIAVIVWSIQTGYSHVTSQFEYWE